MIIPYGWSRGLQHDFEPFAALGLVPARVIVQHRGSYRLMAEAGETEAKLSGRFHHEAPDGGHPAVGDWVAIEPAEGFALIQGLLPRRTVFLRKAAGTGNDTQVAAANVDVALLTVSLNSDLNLRRLERYLAATYESGAAPVVVLTKADGCADVDGAVAQVQAVAAGAPVIAVSAVSGLGLDALAEHLEPRRTAVLLGSSGVGKSTLVNALAGEALMDTGAIRDSDERGRHTTTHRELIRLPSGALILDTPGMRELGLVDAEAGVAAAFAGVEAEVEALAAGCKFKDCAHGEEPGCAVRAALADGRLDPARWESWKKLRRELEHERTKVDPLARHAQQREWISRMKSARAHMKDKRKIE
ncbi:ribosome small subunit-dependent GTPase A [Phenylobacterium sp.]|uniref:ribosome small subunit-dependent GTPase A n=1 Tax=Phenylobacterium sp. TaxID=1871053 RepID=UPI002DF6F3AC|nr:ribosome small subunit-dependent GTPase A [Phenylobacterium sp.]